MNKIRHASEKDIQNEWYIDYNDLKYIARSIEEDTKERLSLEQIEAVIITLINKKFLELERNRNE